jgi:hypothetical protein
MPTYEDLRKMKKAYEEARDAGAKDALRDHFKGLFELHPDVAAIRWRQYTPYFNDGEPCTFNVCDPEVLLVGRNPEVDEYNEGEEDEEGWEYSWELKHPIFRSNSTRTSCGSSASTSRSPSTARWRWRSTSTSTSDHPKVATIRSIDQVSRS